MNYILIDESGDLGFDFRKRKTSNFFVVTVIYTEDKNSLEKFVKKIFRGFTKKEIKNHRGVLHAHKESSKTRLRILKLFSKDKNSKVFIAYLNKNKVDSKMQNQKHVLYNYIINSLLERIYNKTITQIDKKLNIIASRRETNKFLNQKFSSYLKSTSKGNYKKEIEVIISSPVSEKSLQIVDVISWSVFRKYEYSDNHYYDLIKEKILDEDSASI